MRFCLACFPSSRLRTPRQSHRHFQTRNTRTNRHWIPGHSERLAVLFVLSCSQEGQRLLAGGIGCFRDTTIPVLPTRRPALFPMLIVSQRISCQHHCHHPCLSQLRFFPTNSILCLNCIIDLSLVTSTLRSSHYSHLVFITRRNGTLLASLHKWLTGTFRGIESFSQIEELWSNQSACLSDIIHCSLSSLSRIHLQKVISSISSCTNSKSTIMFQVGFIIHSLDYISEYLIRSSVLKVFEKCWVKEYQIVRFLKMRAKPTSSAGEHDLFLHHLEKTPGLKGTDFDVDGKASVWHTWQSALTADDNWQWTKLPLLTDSVEARFQLH